MTQQHDNPSRAPELLQLTSPRPALVDREELHRFKRDIDLRSFALSKGYQLHKKDSTPKWTVLRNGPNDEIVVGRGKNEHWCYFSHSDATDCGSIVDFVRRLGAESWSEIFQELRAWTGKGREDPDPTPALSPESAPDRAAVLRRLAAAVEAPTHPYLEARGLSAVTLSAPRFRGTWKHAPGGHREVLFLHRDEQGLSGAEVKNPGFTGFTRRGTKGLWVSNTTPTDTRLVITESAIDALSYHQVNPHLRTRYVSIAGHLTAKQLGRRTDGRDGLLGAAISWMPSGSTIVAATDNDKAGHKFASRIRDLVHQHPHVTFERHAPRRFRFPDGSIGKDWNDHLQALTRRRAPERSNGQELER